MYKCETPATPFHPHQPKLKVALCKGNMFSQNSCSKYTFSFFRFDIPGSAAAFAFQLGVRAKETAEERLKVRRRLYMQFMRSLLGHVRTKETQRP